MTYRLNGHALPIGEVSGGTHRPEDLLRVFCDEFHKYCSVVPEYVIEAECWLEGDKETIYETYDDDWPWEAVGDYLVAKLIVNLNSLAPEGVYFGTCEGDGASFGWWETEDDQD